MVRSDPGSYARGWRCVGPSESGKPISKRTLHICLESWMRVRLIIMLSSFSFPILPFILERPLCWFVFHQTRCSWVILFSKGIFLLYTCIVINKVACSCFHANFFTQPVVLFLWLLILLAYGFSIIISCAFFFSSSYMFLYIIVLWLFISLLSFCFTWDFCFRTNQQQMTSLSFLFLLQITFKRHAICSLFSSFSLNISFYIF